MNLPQVLILAENEFHRRLMVDVVCCNEMRAVSSGHLDWIDRIESGSFTADVVVLDCGMEAADVTSTVDRLRALPKRRRPKIVGFGADANEVGERRHHDLLLEDEVPEPLDVGCFARAVKQQIQAIIMEAD